MNVPKELMYTKSHEWVKTVDDTTVTVNLAVRLEVIHGIIHS